LGTGPTYDLRPNIIIDAFFNILKGKGKTKP
jgi:hypothetical protein